MHEVDGVRCPVVELRQYTLQPDRRDELISLFDRELVEPQEPLARLQTEPAENTFPTLPVRTGENVFVWFARFPSAADLDRHRHQLARSDRWREQVSPSLSQLLTGPPQQLRLAPTARSLLR
jgi:hypothetical protein